VGVAGRGTPSRCGENPLLVVWSVSQEGRTEGLGTSGCGGADQGSSAVRGKVRGGREGGPSAAERGEERRGE